MQYSSFFLKNKENDIEKLMCNFKFRDIDTENNNQNFAFKKPEGEYVIFGLYGEKFLLNMSDENLKILEEEYDIQNKLLSHYENVIFHGILKDRQLYVFCVINIDNEVCLGVYETTNLISMLGFNFVDIVYERICSFDNSLSGLVITQKNEIDFNKKIFMLT